MPARRIGRALAGSTRSATAFHSPGSAGPSGWPGARPASASHTLIRVSTIATPGTPSASLACSVEGPVHTARAYCRLVFGDLPGLHLVVGRQTCESVARYDCQPCHRGSTKVTGVVQN